MANDRVNKGYLYGIVLVAVLGGLLFGYDTAVISGAEKGLQAFFLNATDFQYSDMMHGFTSSSALIGCVIGALLSGLVASRWGRANGFKDWRYLLIPAGEIKANSTFGQLAQQFRK